MSTESDWAQGILSGLGGGLSGAGAGAAIGSALGGPGIGTAIGGGIGLLTSIVGRLFGGGGMSTEERQALYKQLMDQYVNSPETKQALDKLWADANEKGLTAEEQAGYGRARNAANDFSSGREDAVASHFLASTGGRGVSGMQAILQEGKAQGGADRMAAMSEGAMSLAEQRRRGALQAYLEGAQRNQDALNRYRLAAAGMLGGAMQDQERYGAANFDSSMQNLYGGAYRLASALKGDKGSDGNPPRYDQSYDPNYKGPYAPAGGSDGAGDFPFSADSWSKRAPEGPPPSAPRAALYPPPDPNTPYGARG